MTQTHGPDDPPTVAGHTLAYLRSLDRKLDLVIETSARHSERLARIERDLNEVRRDLGEVRRDVSEVKGDIALLENRILNGQNGLLAILRRLDIDPHDPQA